jgi:hypothetical protein
VDTSSMHTLKNCDKVKKGYRKLLEWLDQKTLCLRSEDLLACLEADARGKERFKSLKIK